MKFPDATLARFAQEVAKFPPDQKQSAVMACLAIVQQELGWVSQEAEEAVAAILGMPPIAVHEVTTFYNMYNQQPVGRWKFNVCTNLPCQLRDGEQALQHLCTRLGVAPYGTSADGRFTVQPSECLGAEGEPGGIEGCRRQTERRQRAARSRAGLGRRKYTKMTAEDQECGAGQRQRGGEGNHAARRRQSRFERDEHQPDRGEGFDAAGRDRDRHHEARERDR